MKKRILEWLKKRFNRKDTKEIAKGRLEFLIARDRNEEDDFKIKFMKQKLDTVLLNYTEESTYTIQISDGVHAELLIHIPMQHIKFSKEEENEYCVNCE